MHLARSTLTYKMIPVFVERVNHVLPPIAAAGRSRQAVVAKGFQFHDAPQDVLKFGGVVQGSWIDVFHGLLEGVWELNEYAPLIH